MHKPKYIDDSAQGTGLDGFRGLDGEYLMDTMEQRRNYLILSDSGSQIKLSASAMQLLQAVESGASFEQLAQALNRPERSENITKEQLEEAYHSLTKKLRAIAAAPYQKLPWGFWIRLPIIPESLAVQISATLSSLYRRGVVGIATVFILLSTVLAVHFNFGLIITDSGFFQGYILFLLSLVVHEFGHAAACARFGARPSDIGFTIYLIYPAFYSDVSAAWKLTRWRRVAVDLGGNYFQFIIGAIYIWAFYATKWEPFRSATIMILYAAIFSLNPILKFDGYWVVADMLGVTNLAEQPIRIISYVYKRITGGKIQDLPWPRSITLMLMAYSVLTLAVWSRFLAHVGPMLLYRCIRVGMLARTIFGEIAGHKMPAFAELRSFLISLLLLVISGVMIFNLFMQLVPPVRKAFTFVISKLRFYKRKILYQP